MSYLQFFAVLAIGFYLGMIFMACMAMAGRDRPGSLSDPRD